MDMIEVIPVYDELFYRITLARGPGSPVSKEEEDSIVHSF